MNIYQGFYTVVRFVPDLLKNEPINIGLIVHSPKIGYIRTEFADKKANIISKYNNDIDPLVVKYIMDDLMQNFDNENYMLRNQKMGNFFENNMLHKIFSAHSNQLQFTEPRGIITQDLDKDFERLFEELVFKGTTIKKEKVIEERTMRSDVKKMLNKFDLIKNNIVKENHIEIDRFGSEIKIDFKYINGKPNLVKNLSLDPKNREPMDHAKLWLKNYEEIKSNAIREGVDNKIQLIYCLPLEDRCENNSIMSCLNVASDELIDYRDSDKIDYFVKKVANTAHN